MQDGPRLLRNRAAAASLALLIGIVTVFGPIALASMLGMRSIVVAEEWNVLALLVGFVAAPFGFLALSRVDHWWPWLVAAGLTIVFWTLLWSNALTRAGLGGANIGLGLLMLMSPVIITLAAALSARRLRRG